MTSDAPGMQDTAKTFSGSTGAKGKYEMYLAATQFDRVFENQRESRLKLAAMVENISKAEGDFQVCLSTATRMAVHCG